MTGRMRYHEQPPEGWPPAPCHTWRRDHPAHGWVGPVSGRLYWCGPKARAWAELIMEAGQDDELAQTIRTEWKRIRNGTAAGGAPEPLDGDGAG